MDKLFENKTIIKLQTWATKLAANKYLSAITNGLMATMAMIMIGSICQILSAIPFLSQFEEILNVPYNMTLNLLAVFASFAMAYSLAGSFNMNKMSAGLVSLALFLMVAAPSATYELADGSSITALITGNLGGSGLFTAILIALLSVRITKFCQDKKLTIRMPDAMPPNLSDSFSAIIPMALNVILFFGLNTVLQNTIGMTLPDAIINVLAAPLGALTSGPGILVVCLFMLVLWVFGIHGTLVGMAVLLPSYIQAITTNAELAASGQSPVFAPIMIAFCIASVGGTGCTLPLAILGLRSKSEQIRAVSKAGLIPGWCNINEPLTFGMPICYNPILAIPYIVGPILYVLLTWLMFSIGFLKPAYIYISALVPIGVAEFLSTLSWTNLVWPYLMIPVLMLVWYPFYKIYENQLVKKEEEARAAAESAGAAEA